ncbi:hypothetical protein TSMEX_001682, partial [Taenia solium]
MVAFTIYISGVTRILLPGLGGALWFFLYWGIRGPGVDSFTKPDWRRVLVWRTWFLTRMKGSGIAGGVGAAGGRRS